MEIKDGRGQKQMEEGAENKNAVKCYFKDNPGSTITECCRTLGLTYLTVKKHINSLKDVNDCIARKV